MHRNHIYHLKEKIKERTYVIKKYKARCEKLESLSDEQIVLWSNNVRNDPNIAEYVYNMPPKDSKHPFDITRPIFKERILQVYADRGDPLSKAILVHLNTLSPTNKDETLAGSLVPELILARRITQDQSEGILRRTIPFSQNHGTPIYLPPPLTIKERVSDWIIYGILGYEARLNNNLGK